MSLSPSPRPPPTEVSSSDLKALVDSRLTKPKFGFLRPKRRSTSSVQSSSSPSLATTQLFPPPGSDAVIDVGPSSNYSIEDEQYRWAVVFENQRGLRIGSSLYFSRSSLLPIDPLPFTAPDADPRRSRQPNFTLAMYPLPDGAWAWLSPWMVDMRSDSGEVQLDGFEYNWAFREHKWHPQAGAFSWVRRRRWMRLMVRPVTPQLSKTTESSTPLSVPNSVSNSAVKKRMSMLSSGSPSMPESNAEDDSYSASMLERELELIWMDDNAEVNWDRCRFATRCAGRDGRILELWARWLGYTPPEGTKRNPKRQWTEDDDDIPCPAVPDPVSVPHTPPPIAHIIPVLREHTHAILQSFIFPESRAKFVKMLDTVGVLSQLETGIRSISSEVNFFSYLNPSTEKNDGNIIPPKAAMTRV
ncbi:unnamed protein product [Mycena citricolor]|uniref:Peroxin domain-containing protein n=1 Tax=Mycena citricolor TaxID=2018698 RepID=A0AAD2K5F0_9AGAR|nr:unnamed protein product [Mycena citricolor]